MARYGYERLSNDRSLRRINVDIQLAEIDEFALDTGEPTKRHFDDNNKSASEFGTKPRDGYIDLIATIMRSTEPEDEIIITEVPRLCRKTEEAVELIRLSKTTPLRFITTTDGMKYDLRTPRGRKSFREAVSDAEFESDQSSSRQNRKKNKLAEAGAFHGGQRPYAYEGAQYEELVTPDGEKVKGRLLNPGRVGVVVIEEEAAVRIEGTQRIIAGEREVDIVRDLNGRNVPAPGGGKWRMGNFRRLLCRRRDVAFNEFPGPGIRVHKGREYRAIWPAIISREDYELMIAAFKLNRNNRRKAGTVKGRRYLLSGIVHCEHPGHGPMYGKGRVLRSGTYERRYGCRSQDEHGTRVPGPKTYRKAEPVDLWVTESVIAAFDTPEVAAALAPTENRDRVKDLVEQRAKQQLHIQQLVADYGARLLSREELVIAKQAAETVLDDTEAELAKIQTTRAVAAIPAGQTLREFMETASIELRRKVILTAVDHVILKSGLPGKTKWRGFKFDPESVEIVWRR